MSQAVEMCRDAEAEVTVSDQGRPAALAWKVRATGVVAVIVTLFGLTLPNAAAATGVSVRWGTCSGEYRVPASLGFGGGVNLSVGARSARNLTLSGKYSWGWNRDGRGLNLPSTWKNQYHVRFLDSRGRVVWTGYNAIPNGGSRKFWVGSNVRTIQVIAGVGADAFGRARVPAVAPAVSYAG